MDTETEENASFKFYIAGPLKFESTRIYLDKIEEIVKRYGFDTWSPYKNAGILSREDLKNPQKVKEVLEKDILAFEECDGAIFLLDGEHTGTIFELGYAYSIAKNKRKDFPLIGVYTTVRGKESLDSMIRFCLEEKGLVVTSLSELEKFLDNFRKTIITKYEIKEYTKEEQNSLRSTLKIIKNEFKVKNYQVELFTDELSAICPFTELPDYYKLYIIYTPDENLVELRSLKLYLVQFKNLKLTHEALCNKIFEDLFDLLKPRYIRIELEANVRGGIKAIVRRDYPGDEDYVKQSK